MIKSMTGYGRAREMLHKRDITVEVRSVNNRYLDCTVKMPRMYGFAEDAVKQHVQKAISRGKVDVFITVDASAADVAKVTVNRELAAQYAAALGELAEVCGTEPHVTPETLSRFPDVLTVTKADEDLETVSADLCAVLDEALQAYNAMRAVEGAKLAEDIGNRLTYIENYTSQVEKRSPETVAEYRAKLTARMQEVLQSTTIDEQRILTEAAIYADKVAVDEETVRLRSHVAQLRTMIASDEPMGRKMDFLIQEVNRESNTIGSKCNDVAIAQVVVGLKAEVEKMREQVQNVECRYETHQYRIRQPGRGGARRGDHLPRQRADQATCAGRQGRGARHRRLLRPPHPRRPHHGFRPCDPLRHPDRDALEPAGSGGR